MTERRIVQYTTYILISHAQVNLYGTALNDKIFLIFLYVRTYPILSQKKINLCCLLYTSDAADE